MDRMTLLPGIMKKPDFFTVKSAYKLAARIKFEQNNQAGSSDGGNDGCPMYKEIWSAVVPPKVQIFAWKLTTDGLATKDKRNHRGLAPSNVCCICGKGVETGHHAVISCTKARALWKEICGRLMSLDDN
jgi:hypothetical protein